MAIAKLRPIPLLSVLFGLYIVISIAMIIFAIYFHQHASGLAKGQPAMHAKEGAALMRIRSETDITKLRSFAITVHNGSVRDWNALVSITSDVDSFLQGACAFQIGASLLIGTALYGLIRHNRNP